MNNERTSDEYKMIITRCLNGYVVSGKNIEGIKEVIVIEDDNRDELKSHETLLWEIMDYFDIVGSKHDKERIEIQRKKRK